MPGLDKQESFRLLGFHDSRGPQRRHYTQNRKKTVERGKWVDGVEDLFVKSEGTDEFVLTGNI